MCSEIHHTSTNNLQPRVFLQREMYHIWAGTTFNMCHDSWTTNKTEYKADFSLLQCLQANATLDV